MSNTPLLDRIDSPDDLKKLRREDLHELVRELRKTILDTVTVTGGHLGSGMGVVELTVALHWVFDFAEDRLVFDVGHQVYPHKLLTGRKDRFHTLRRRTGSPASATASSRSTTSTRWAMPAPPRRRRWASRPVTG